MTTHSNGRTISTSLGQIHQRIETACGAAGRTPTDVRLLAVSKTKPLSAVMAAYDYGQRHFGENYLQDALVKIEQCPYKDVEWHFIGAMQSNKTKTIAEQFDWVHTLDRLKIARRLNDQRPDHLPPLKVLIQVNINNETNKSGVSLAELPALVNEITRLSRLYVCGLMCIPKAGQGDALTQLAFTQMANARDALQKDFPNITELSMGMSADLHHAIACGTTIVRIGTDIFGARDASAPT